MKSASIGQGLKLKIKITKLSKKNICVDIVNFLNIFF